MANKLGLGHSYDEIQLLIIDREPRIVLMRYDLEANNSPVGYGITENIIITINHAKQGRM